MPALRLPPPVSERVVAVIDAPQPRSNVTDGGGGSDPDCRGGAGGSYITTLGRTAVIALTPVLTADVAAGDELAENV